MPHAVQLVTLLTTMHLVLQAADSAGKLNQNDVLTPYSDVQRAPQMTAVHCHPLN